ncbi:MAG: sigma-70 family RNA polymerase sigma factor [Polyangiales bacterium]
MTASFDSRPAPVDVRDLDAHRGRLTAHCYRMLGSVAEADDAVQETLLRAWRAREGFDGRASLRTWLTRIATNVCLDARADARRRTRPMDDGPAGTTADALVVRPASHWVEPIPDALLTRDDPDDRVDTRARVRLALVAALQHLPARQRAALLLADVADFSAAEVGEALDLTVPAVNSALQRARATLAARGEDLAAAPRRDDAAPPALLERYVSAFERYDAAALAALCREDVEFNMPPYALWLRGPEAVRAWLLGRGCGCRGSRLVATRANGGPAFGQYRPSPDGDGHRAWGLVTLEFEGGAIRRWTTFLETAALFPRFGLPLSLPPDGA